MFAVFYSPNRLLARHGESLLGQSIAFWFSAYEIIIIIFFVYDINTTVRSSHSVIYRVQILKARKR
jgi:hypothetical protein